MNYKMKKRRGVINICDLVEYIYIYIYILYRDIYIENVLIVYDILAIHNYFCTT